MTMKLHSSTSPSRKECEAAWQNGQASVVFSVEAADLLTPVSAYMRLTHLHTGAGRHSLLLESVEGGVSRGRYSVIALMPDLIWTCHNGQVSIEADGHTTTALERPLDSLRQLIQETRLTLPPGVPPMIAGLFGYLGYDMVRQMEHLPDAPPDDLNLPEAILMRPGLFAVFDTVTDELILAAPVRPAAGETGGIAWDRAHGLLARARACLAGALPAPQIHQNVPPFSEPVQPLAMMNSAMRFGVFRTTSQRAMRFRLCPASAFPRRFRFPRLICTGRYGGSTRLRSCSILILAGFRWLAHRPKFWCVCETAK